MAEQFQSRLSKVFGSKPASSGASAAPTLARKPAAQPQPQPQPKAVGGGGEVKQITIQMPTISIRIDEHFKAKLPFLLLMLLLFAFSLVLFEKSNFHTIDIVDLGRLQYNVSKLWSVSFVLFLLLYSFSVALAMFYGFNQNWASSLLVAVPALVIAGVASLFFLGGYLLAFLAFALTLSAASLVSSFRTQVKFSSIYSTAGSAVLVLVVLSFFVAFNQISANKDAYIDAFISSGVTTSIAQVQDISLGALLTPNAVRSAVTKEKLRAMITEGRVAKWFEGNPDFTKLSSAIKNSTITAVRAKLVDDLHSQTQNDLPALLANVRLGGSGGASGLGAATGASGGIKQVLGQTPAFVVFYNNFALLSSLLIASIVAVFAFVIKLVATLLCWLLAKL